MDALDFSKRKIHRERTLLANINDVKVSKVVEVDEKQMPGQRQEPVSASPARVKVWEKNPAGKNVRMNPKTQKEEDPAAHRQQEEFMQMGGKGDMQLFGNDVSSRYLPEEVPKK